MTSRTSVNMNAKIFIASALTSILATGCGIFGGNDKKPAPLPDVGAANALKSAWQASTGKAGDYFFSPAVSDGKVFAASFDGTIAVVDEASGRSAARFEVGDRLSAGVGVALDTVAVTTIRGDLVTFDSLGKLKWRVPIGGEVLASPEVGANVVVVRTTDGRVMAHNISDGKRAWLYTRSLPVLTLRSNAGMLLTKGEAVMGVPGGRVIVLDIETGKLLAEFNIANPKGASELERVADISGTPLLEERRLCAVAYQGRVGCFDTTNGTAIWAKDASSAVGIGADGKNIYVSLEDVSVQAFSKDAGASVWKNTQLQRRTLSAPVATAKGLVVGDQQGNVLLLSLETGAVIGRMTTDGSPVQAVMPAGNSAVVVTRGGSIVSLGL